MYVNRRTFISASEDKMHTLNTLLRCKHPDQAALEKNFCKSVFCEYDVFKHFSSTVHNTDSYLNAISSFLFVINRLEFRSLEHTHSHARTHRRANRHARTRTLASTNTVGSRRFQFPQTIRSVEPRTHKYILCSWITNKMCSSYISTSATEFVVDYTKINKTEPKFSK
jgi:hypothetical protein